MKHCGYTYRFSSRLAASLSQGCIACICSPSWPFPSSVFQDGWPCICLPLRPLLNPPSPQRRYPPNSLLHGRSYRHQTLKEALSAQAQFSSPLPQLYIPLSKHRSHSPPQAQLYLLARGRRTGSDVGNVRRRGCPGRGSLCSVLYFMSVLGLRGALLNKTSIGGDY